MMKFRTLFLLPFLFLTSAAFSQVSIKDSAIFTPLIYATYTYQFPGGDLAERYGSNSSIGGGFMLKSKHNWVYGVEGNFMFGGTVKNSDSILRGISTHDGFVISQTGFYGDMTFSERGYNFSLKFGKLFAIAPNPNSGILLLGGIGYLQNKIRIHTIETAIPSAEGDYAKGYDKLNGGTFVSGSLGYMFLSNSRLLNFYAGFEVMQTWTKSKRDFDFETEMKDTKKYSSQFYGIKIKWMIPLYKRTPKSFYLY